MQDDPLSRGILSGLMGAKDTSLGGQDGFTSSEAGIRKDIERRRSLCLSSFGLMGGLATLGSGSGELEALRTEERLLDFASRRGISLSGDWKSRAILAAAMDHPEIKREPKRVGRPRSIKNQGGILSRALRAGAFGRIEDQNDVLLTEINNILDEFEAQGKPRVQRKAVEEYLKRTNGPRPVATNYEPTVNKLLRHLGKTRTLAGSNLKRGPKGPTRKPRNLRKK
jgi:hypothetical protein